MLEAIEQICRKLGLRGRTVAALLSWLMLIFVACAAAVLAARTASAAQPQIVARVNGDPLTRAELQQLRANPLTLRQLQQELGVDQPDAKELDRLALRRLIQRRLMLQEAGLKGITVTDGELDQAIASFRRRFADAKRFGEWRREQGLDDRSLLESARGDVLVERARAALVREVRIADEQVQQYYETHREKLKTGEIRLQIIAVKDQAAAQEIVKSLHEGKHFASLARERSVGRRAAQGGDTGWVADETLWPELREFVSGMKVGYARGPLRNGDRFLIVRVTDRRAGKALTLAEAKPQIEAYLLDLKQQEVVRDWLAEKEKKAKVEVLLADLKSTRR